MPLIYRLQSTLEFICEIGGMDPRDKPEDDEYAVC
jgi:hypothetical protein